MLRKNESVGSTTKTGTENGKTIQDKNDSIKKAKKLKNSSESLPTYQDNDLNSKERKPESEGDQINEEPREMCTVTMDEINIMDIRIQGNGTTLFDSNICTGEDDCGQIENFSSSETVVFDEDDLETSKEHSSTENETKTNANGSIVNIADDPKQESLNEQTTTLTNETEEADDDNHISSSPKEEIVDTTANEELRSFESSVLGNGTEPQAEKRKMFPPNPLENDKSKFIDSISLDRIDGIFVPEIIKLTRSDVGPFKRPTLIDQQRDKLLLKSNEEDHQTNEQLMNQSSSELAKDETELTDEICFEGASSIEPKVTTKDKKFKSRAAISDPIISKSFDNSSSSKEEPKTMFESLFKARSRRPIYASPPTLVHFRQNQTFDEPGDPNPSPEDYKIDEDDEETKEQVRLG